MLFKVSKNAKALCGIWCESGMERAAEQLSIYLTKITGAEYQMLDSKSGARFEIVFDKDIKIEHMSGMPMSAFVSDYDHNAPTHEHLRNTHSKLYKKIRINNPDIPYFMVTRPNFYFDEDAICRRDIIMESYLEARAAGDKNVYFIDGSAFFNGRDPRDLTPDLAHPNDEGYALMAKYIGDVIGKVMKY